MKTTAHDTIQTMDDVFQESTQWLAATLKSIAEAVIVTNNEGIIIFMNPVAETLTGWKQTEIRGREILFITSSVDEEADDIFAPGEILISLTDEPFLVTRHGTRIPIEYSGAPVKDERGNVVGMVLVIQNITERKRTETALCNAKQAAEAANRAKSMFLASMGHELRTPLNIILGYAQLLQDAENLTAHQHREIENIQRSGEHLLTLLNDILDVANLETEHLELHVHEFEFIPFLRRVVEIAKMHVDQKGLTFMFSPHPDLPLRIFADEQRLRQVLLNLLGNAVKFTKQGEIIFRVTLESPNNVVESRSQSQVFSPTLLPVHLRFEIEDTGIGIPAEKLQDIVLPFQQIDGQYHSIDGAGIGLTIVQYLLRLMDAELRMSSTVGKGSRFWFDLTVPAVPQADALSTEDKKKGDVRFSEECHELDRPGGATGSEQQPLHIEHVRHLLTCAERGSPKKLLDELNKLEELEPCYQPLLDKLRRYAQNYQIEQCIELLRTEEGR